MRLQTVSLDQIKPYDNNPRINDDAVDAVVNSLNRNGYRARIIVDSNLQIIAGHTRYKAMQRLGWKEAEVWIADDMTPEQVKDYRIRDNLTSEYADWDFEKLKEELAGMEADFDMAAFGFESSSRGGGSYSGSPESTGSDLTPQKINVGGEIDIENYSDDKFNCECPKCGFRFNV